MAVQVQIHLLGIPVLPACQGATFVQYPFVDKWTFWHLGKLVTLLPELGELEAYKSSRVVGVLFFFPEWYKSAKYKRLMLMFLQDLRFSSLAPPCLVRRDLLAALWNILQLFLGMYCSDSWGYTLWDILQ